MNFSIGIFFRRKTVTLAALSRLAEVSLFAFALLLIQPNFGNAIDHRLWTKRAELLGTYNWVADATQHAEDGPSAGWGYAPVLNGYLNMYTATGDTIWLDKFIALGFEIDLANLRNTKYTRDLFLDPLITESTLNKFSFSAGPTIFPNAESSPNNKNSHSVTSDLQSNLTKVSCPDGSVKSNYSIENYHPAESSTYNFGIGSNRYFQVEIKDETRFQLEEIYPENADIMVCFKASVAGTGYFRVFYEGSDGVSHDLISNTQIVGDPTGNTFRAIFHTPSDSTKRLFVRIGTNADSNIWMHTLLVRPLGTDLVETARVATAYNKFAWIIKGSKYYSFFSSHEYVIAANMFTSLAFGALSSYSFDPVSSSLCIYSSCLANLIPRSEFSQAWGNTYPFNYMNMYAQALAIKGWIIGDTPSIADAQKIANSLLIGLRDESSDPNDSFPIFSCSASSANCSFFYQRPLLGESPVVPMSTLTEDSSHAAISYAMMGIVKQHNWWSSTHLNKLEKIASNFFAHTWNRSYDRPRIRKDTWGAPTADENAGQFRFNYAAGGLAELLHIADVKAKGIWSVLDGILNSNKDFSAGASAYESVTGVSLYNDPGQRIAGFTGAAALGAYGGVLNGKFEVAFYGDNSLPMYWMRSANLPTNARITTDGTVNSTKKQWVRVTSDGRTAFPACNSIRQSLKHYELGTKYTYSFNGFPGPSSNARVRVYRTQFSTGIQTTLASGTISSNFWNTPTTIQFYSPESYDYDIGIEFLNCSATAGTYFDIDNVNIVMTYGIANGGFEAPYSLPKPDGPAAETYTRPAGWRVLGTNPISNFPEHFYYVSNDPATCAVGNDCLRINHSQSTLRTLEQQIAFEPGQSYTLKASGRRTTTNNTGVKIAIVDVETTTYFTLISIDFNVTTWMGKCAVFTAPTSANHDLRIWVQRSDDLTPPGDVEGYVDEIRIESGSVCP